MKMIISYSPEVLSPDFSLYIIIFLRCIECHQHNRMHTQNKTTILGSKNLLAVTGNKYINHHFTCFQIIYTTLHILPSLKLG